MKPILALDQGTTSTRAILFDPDGGVRALAQREFRQIFPRPGWVEHDAEEIWRVQLDVAREAISNARLDAEEIAGIGITNQRETVVLWDRKTGIPVHNAIVWQDRRTAAQCDRLREEGHAETFRKKTGLVIDAYFSGTKLAWLLDNVDGVRARAESGDLAFGTIDSWLVWKLTEGRVHVTDASNASRTLLYDIANGEWDPELLEILEIPRDVLPDVRGSSEVYGEATLLGSSIPVAGMAGDQQAALFGQVCTRPGMAKNTYGTGCFLLMNTGTDPVDSKNQLLTTVAWRIGDTTEYALEGSVFIAGAAVQWLRDGLGIVSRPPDVETLARSVDDTGDVYFVPAFAGLGAPYWDPYARGALVGLTRGTTQGHIARATLESMAHQTADLMEAIQEDSGITLTELRVDGGASANDLLLQIQADLLGVPVVRPTQIETTALGAAYLAGLAVGVWKSTDEIADQWGEDRRFEPAVDSDQVANRRARWQKAVGRARDWAEADA